MTRKIAGTCFAAVLGFALSAAAQTPPSSSSPSPSPSTPQTAPAPTSPYPSSQSADKSDKAGKSTKLTGCVQSGTTAGTFELTNIKKGMKSDSASAADSSAGASSSSKTVKLVAAAGVDLTQHVGHQVEVTGSWDKSGASASATPPTPDAPASASASSGKGGDFNVTDVKMVSATCSAGTN